MAVIYTSALRTTRMTATRDACAGGALQLLDSGGNVLSSHTLSPTGGTVADGDWTLAFANATAAASGTGTATAARIRNSSDADVATGLTVGLTDSGADVELQNTSINAGQDIIISSATLTDG
ncbi:hypothetical protein SAMN05444389_101451 [Paracoccus solventivorans]|uniref:Uncharacterized protein n=1 Tax=Paracoccus solventivorans TaxID=53463 RepID=A0A1M7DN45_9RHOB|nr:hypothetical protein [Paracoccus solventivorans]SHL80808.1 hypothetical protein SAMN05444389_101451 [Paracoccus solventivorans]